MASRVSPRAGAVKHGTLSARYTRETRLPRLLLLVGRVAVIPQDSLHQHAQLRAHVLADRPVDGDVPADCCYQITRNRPQRLIAALTPQSFVSSASWKASSSCDSVSASEWPLIS